MNLEALSKDEAIQLAVKLLKKHRDNITSKDVYELISFLPPKSVENAYRKKLFFCPTTFVLKSYSHTVIIIYRNFIRILLIRTILITPFL